MRRAALYAREQGYDCFTTSLSISPHKNSAWINEIGLRLEEELGITFVHSDFKKHDGYHRSIQLAKEYGLYRQDWCGCVYSRREREAQKARRAAEAAGSAPEQSTPEAPPGN